MPGTNPSAITGYVSAYAFDADTLGGADGSTVTSYGGVYSVPGTYAGPTLKHSAVNSLKSLVFAPGKALLATFTGDTPATISLSGGYYPNGISAMAVVKATDLSALTAPPHTGTRRTILGFRAAFGFHREGQPYRTSNHAANCRL